MMDKKPADEMSEALMRRRHGFAQKHLTPAKGNIGNEMPSPALEEMLNKGGAEVAPAGATPEVMNAATSGDAMTLTPEMFMQLMGSSGNGGGLRGRVMEDAAAMKKKC